MKNTKRILSVFLSIILALGAFSLNAFAEEMPASNVDWSEFYITAQPKRSTVIDYGESFTLSVEVHIPVGVEVAYQWYPYYEGYVEKVEGFTAQTVTIDKDNPYYPRFSLFGLQKSGFFCEITGMEKDENGNVISIRSINSESAIVKTQMSVLSEALYVMIQPWEVALNAVLLVTGMSYGAAIPFTPLIFIAGLFLGFFGSLKYVITN